MRSNNNKLIRIDLNQHTSFLKISNIQRLNIYKHDGGKYCPVCCTSYPYEDQACIDYTLDNGSFYSLPLVSLEYANKLLETIEDYNA